jgi:hypothetical protein
MGLLKRLFSGAASSAPDFGALFLDRMQGHRARIITAGPLYRDFVQRYLSDATLAILAPAASEKMQLTVADGNEHSMMLAKSPVCYVVCTIPVAIRGGSGWFEERYGGYTKILEYCWNSAEYRAAGCEVLCHSTFGHTSSETWVNITIFPIRSTQFTFQPILAIDLLSNAEKRANGVP